MLIKNIKYIDYNGEEREEEFHFHLSKAELMGMNLKVEGGLENVIDKIIKTRNIPELIELFEQIIDASYGEKSLDGKRFVKSKELTEAFKQTEAYSNLYIELISDIDKAAEFINSVVPADVAVAAEELKKNQTAKHPTIDEIKARANVDSLPGGNA